MKHQLVRVASDRKLYPRTKDRQEYLFTKPLDIETFYMHAEIVLNVVRCHPEA